MHRELHFPTPIYIADIKHPTLNQELERDILAWSKQDKGIVRTNVQGWHSTTNMHELPQFKKLVDMLYACQKTIYEQEYYESEPFLGNMWANINPPGGMNRAHQHPNSLWSGVYYIRVPENSGKLFIEDPRPGPQTYMPRRLENLPKALWRVVAYEPKEGRMVFFPSWLPHGVDINQSKEQGEASWRISVSFNFIQT